MFLLSPQYVKIKFVSYTEYQSKEQYMKNNISSRRIFGIISHPDAGKTTLSEALLYRSGAIRRPGRVDRGDAFLDTDAI